MPAKDLNSEGAASTGCICLSIKKTAFRRSFSLGFLLQLLHRFAVGKDGDPAVLSAIDVRAQLFEHLDHVLAGRIIRPVGMKAIFGAQADKNAGLLFSYRP